MPPDEPAATSAQPDPTPAPPPAEPDLSLAEHEKAFHRRASTELASEIVQSRTESIDAQTEPATPPAEAPEPETEQQRLERERDPATGKFVRGTRHRAQSQQATPDDVPRIQQLTARLRQAEAERDALRASSSPPVAAVPPAPPSPPAATRPQPDPSKYDDFNKYTADLVAWNVEQAVAKYQAEQLAKAQQEQSAAERVRLEQSWRQRTDAAMKQYPDFAEVALETPSRIPPGSLIDAWILEHDAGADVLYKLQKDPTILDRLLSEPLFKQAESLALLSQRTNGTSPTPAVATGSAAAEKPRTPAPRPPNPVRTGPMTAGDEPPDEERIGLSDHERWYPQRRRHG